MARERPSENSNPGRRPRPKVIVVGRLQGTAGGRPFTVLAEGEEILVNVAGVRALRPFLNLAKIILQRSSGLDWKLAPRIRVRVKGLSAISVKPNSFVWNLLLGSGKK